MRLRNSESGMIGSLARDSASTNNGSSSPAITASTTIGGEPHAYVVPPRLIRRARKARR